MKIMLESQRCIVTIDLYIKRGDSACTAKADSRASKDIVSTDAYGQTERGKVNLSTKWMGHNVCLNMAAIANRTSLMALHVSV